MIAVVAHITAQAETVALVEEVLQSYLAPTRAEEGCVKYELYRDLDNPLRFTFIEEWTSREALAVHSRSAHITAGRARLEGKLAEASWVQVLEKVG